MEEQPERRRLRDIVQDALDTALSVVICPPAPSMPARRQSPMASAR